MTKPKPREIIDQASMLFRLSMDNFEEFYEGHETRESKIALQAVKNLHTIFQSYCQTYEKSREAESIDAKE